MLHCSPAAVLLLVAWLSPLLAYAAQESSGSPAMDESFSNIVAGFNQPRRDCSQVPFWFWNGSLDPEEFRAQLREMARQGVYAAMPHPRFGMDRREYLEEPFWRAMAAALDEADKLGMQLWLYDDYNWPSGGAGGRVTDGRPELYPRGLDYCRFKVQGPQEFRLGMPTNTEPRMERFEKYLCAYIRPEGAAEGEWRPWGSLDEQGKDIHGAVAAGSWEVHPRSAQYRRAREKQIPIS